MNDFLKAYIVCALWSSVDVDDHPLDKNYRVSDITLKTLQKMQKDCDDFCLQAHDLLDGLDPAQCGHDFWLTRVGHGSGFWDRGLGERGERLTEIARSFREGDLYVGDDGLIHCI